MNRRFTQLAVLCAITAGSSFATLVSSTNPLDFADPVDWCQLGCANAQLPTPQAWTSTGGATGSVGLNNSGEGFFNMQQGAGWFGDFDPGMGLIYNGAFFGNNPADIAITFDSAHNGGGAFIQSQFYGPFTATLELFDVNFQSLGIVTTTGTAADAPGTAIFIGAYDTVNPVWAMVFHAELDGGTDFAIGTMRLDFTGDTATPEPSTLISLGAGLLGLVSLAKRRRK